MASDSALVGRPAAGFCLPLERLGQTMDSAILRPANPNFSIKKPCRIRSRAAPRLEKLDDHRQSARFSERLGWLWLKALAARFRSSHFARL